MVLNDIIDQVSERPQSKATHFSSAYQVGYFPIKHSPIWLLLCCRTTMTRDPRWRTLCSTASREPRTWCVSGIVAGCGSGLQRYNTLLTNVSEINVNKYYYWLCSVCVLLMIYLYLLMLHPQVLSIIVFDPFTELFITLCIVVNVLFMSADHYDVEYDGMWVLQSTSLGSDSIWIFQNMAKSLR